MNHLPISRKCPSACGRYQFFWGFIEKGILLKWKRVGIACNNALCPATATATAPKSPPHALFFIFYPIKCGVQALKSWVLLHFKYAFFSFLVHLLSPSNQFLAIWHFWNLQISHSISSFSTGFWHYITASCMLYIIFILSKVIVFHFLV